MSIPSTSGWPPRRVAAVGWSGPRGATLRPATRSSSTWPTDGTPTDFWVLGRFQTPSRTNWHARIAVFTPARVTPLVSFWLMVRVRKDAQTLTYFEKRRFLSALARIDRHRGPALYQNYRDAHTADTSDEAHDLDAFLPWHRAYLLDLERELQAVDPSVTMPYWRFDRPAPAIVLPSCSSGLQRADRRRTVSRRHNPLQLFSSDGQIGISRLPRFDARDPDGRQRQRTGDRRSRGDPMPAIPYARLCLS